MIFCNRTEKKHIIYAKHPCGWGALIYGTPYKKRDDVPHALIIKNTIFK